MNQICVSYATSNKRKIILDLTTEEASRVLSRNIEKTLYSVIITFFTHLIFLLYNLWLIKSSAVVYTEK